MKVELEVCLRLLIRNSLLLWNRLLLFLTMEDKLRFKDSGSLLAYLKIESYMFPRLLFSLLNYLLRKARSVGRWHLLLLRLLNGLAEFSQVNE